MFCSGGRGEASREAVDCTLAGLRGLKGKIAGVVDFSCGANFSDRAQGYAHGLSVRFTGRAALGAYGPYTEHRRVLQKRSL
ncbi:MAG TPA: Dabb family protein [Pyrinomonadaceae bacterium]|nr:Dabb family protein [Pyrinomonadaceae bacterium]